MSSAAVAAPERVRVAWVSEAARDVWSERLSAINAAWWEATWRSVSEGLRAAAIMHMPPSAAEAAAPTWAAHGLQSEVLAISDGPAGQTLRIGLTRSGAPSLGDARREGGDEAVGELLGYPACCRRFFSRVWVREKQLDTTWAMAGGELSAQRGALEVAGSAACNILHRWLGVRAVQHLPCSFGCAATEAVGGGYLDLLRQLGYAQEAATLLEVLSWPVEWSALHGYAEVRSPITKLLAPTDRSAGKRVVRRISDSYPADGGEGIAFPYRRAERRPPPTGVALPAEAWRWRENGFGSALAMVAAHAPVADYARARLGGGRVLDLGCGNGALLKAVCGEAGEPFGVDLDAQAIAHARADHPSHSANFICGDLFTAPRDHWPAERFDVVLLMPGRLVERGGDDARQLLAFLRGAANAVIVYVYPGYASTLREAVAAAGLELSDVAGSVGRLRLAD